jgi:hypothetical protein
VMGGVIDVHPRADEAANQLARGEDAGGCRHRLAGR